jgi:hypothetical protein
MKVSTLLSYLLASVIGLPLANALALEEKVGGEMQEDESSVEEPVGHPYLDSLSPKLRAICEPFGPIYNSNTDPPWVKYSDQIFAVIAYRWYMVFPTEDDHPGLGFPEAKELRGFLDASYCTNRETYFIAKEKFGNRRYAGYFTKSR